jgi:hypothetical protein
MSVASLLQSHNPEGMSEGSVPVHTRQTMQQTSSRPHNCREISKGTRNYSPQPVPLAVTVSLARPPAPASSQACCNTDAASSCTR